MADKAEQMTIKLTSMAHGGSALGRGAAGRVIFVPYAIPGETVRVQVPPGKPSYAHAHLLKVLKSSADRVTPRCPHYGVCGGCHFQHIAYRAQLRFKRQVVVDQLKRVGKFRQPSVAGTFASPEPWAYRSSVSLSPTPDGELGFWSPSEHQVISITECHIIQQPLLDLFRGLDLQLPGLRRVTLRAGARGDLLVVFETDNVEPPSLEADFAVSAAMLLPTGESANLIGDNILWERCAERAWQVSAGSFFQVNRGAAEHLVKLVKQFSSLKGSEAVLELYSGVGLFTAGLSAGAKKVVGIEASPDAVSDAVANLADTENVELYEGPVEEILPGLADDHFDLVVLDPPRGGVGPAVIKALLAIRAPRLVYVSCDPATFSRDARQLTQGGYRLVDVRPVDMFPQTFHVETASLLTLKR